MPAPRPTQPPTPAPDAFRIHRAEVAPGMRLAYLQEGTGGYPLVLLHGYPETKRIWWRNIRPLVAAGYEVIVPDLRGYGDSDLAADDDYDLVRYGRDVHALVHDVLGHERCGMIAGDVGGAVMIDIAQRFAGFVDAMVFFNSTVPVVPDQPEWYAERGLSMQQLDDDDPTADYRVRQGRDPDALIAELDSPARCRQYVTDFYGPRLWASPGSFSVDDVAFMVEPFADIDHLAASWAPYQLAHGRPLKEIPLLAGPIDTPTLILYGPDDHVVPRDFPTRCEIAFTNRVGPLVAPDSGHFLQWERADVLNGVSAAWFATYRDTAALRAGAAPGEADDDTA